MYLVVAVCLLLSLSLLLLPPLLLFLLPLPLLLFLFLNLKMAVHDEAHQQASQHLHRRTCQMMAFLRHFEDTPFLPCSIYHTKHAQIQYLQIFLDERVHLFYSSFVSIFH